MIYFLPLTLTLSLRGEREDLGYPPRGEGNSQISSVGRRKFPLSIAQASFRETISSDLLDIQISETPIV